MTNLVKHYKSREWSKMLPLNDKRFANNCFTKGPLHCKEFGMSHPSYFYCMQLSNDESFVITGGCHKNLLEEYVSMFSIGKLFGIQSEIKPTMIHTVDCNFWENEQICICSLAISPDDRRILSSSLGQERILIHDIQR